jgi:uncharacterized protein YqgV (UPF0045/DUF77 family)
MEIAVEISLYPLDRDFVPPIADFIERLRAHGGLRVVTNSMSTQVVGPYDAVMAALTGELRGSFESGVRGVFVLKVLGALPLVPSPTPGGATRA